MPVTDLLHISDRFARVICPCREPCGAWRVNPSVGNGLTRNAAGPDATTIVGDVKLRSLWLRCYETPDKGDQVPLSIGRVVAPRLAAAKGLTIVARLKKNVRSEARSWIQEQAGQGALFALPSDLRQELIRSMLGEAATQ